MAEPGWDVPASSPRSLWDAHAACPQCPHMPCSGGSQGGQGSCAGLQGGWRGCTHQLDRDHQDSLEREGPITQIKEIFQAGSEQLQHHGVVLPTGAKVVNLRNSFCKRWSRGCAGLQQGHAVTARPLPDRDRGCRGGDVPALPSLHRQPGSALGSRGREAAPSASLTLLQGRWGERTKSKEIKDEMRRLCKTSLSLQSRWAGAQAGSEAAESHLGKTSLPAVPLAGSSPGQLSPAPYLHCRAVCRTDTPGAAGEPGILWVPWQRERRTVK